MPRSFKGSWALSAAGALFMALPLIAAASRMSWMEMQPNPHEGGPPEAPGGRKAREEFRVPRENLSSATETIANLEGVLRRRLHISWLGSLAQRRVLDPIQHASPTGDCLLGASGSREGCASGGCRCGWTQQCYPQYKLSDQHKNQGVCDTSMLVLVTISTLVIVFVIMTVVVLRMMLQWRDMQLEADALDLHATKTMQDVGMLQARLSKRLQSGASSAASSQRGSGSTSQRGSGSTRTASSHRGSGSLPPTPHVAAQSASAVAGEVGLPVS